jgi:hypothetical protein
MATWPGAPERAAGGAQGTSDMYVRHPRGAGHRRVGERGAMVFEPEQACRLANDLPIRRRALQRNAGSLSGRWAAKAVVKAAMGREMPLDDMGGGIVQVPPPTPRKPPGQGLVSGSWGVVCNRSLPWLPAAPPRATPPRRAHPGRRAGCGCWQSGIGRLRGPLAISYFQEAKTVVHSSRPEADLRARRDRRFRGVAARREAAA